MTDGSLFHCDCQRGLSQVYVLIGDIILYFVRSSIVDSNHNIMPFIFSVDFILTDCVRYDAFHLSFLRGLRGKVVRMQLHGVFGSHKVAGGSALRIE